MQYLFYPFILLAYFELLGRWVLMKFNHKTFEFSFVVGFAALMGAMFLLLWPITALNQSFYLLLAAFLLMIAASIICIIKDRKQIDFHFSWKLWLLMIVMLVVQTYISSTRTLGEVHGFDTLYYLNMIDFNIGNTALNSLHPHYGTYPNIDIRWHTYIFQSYYYFVPVIIYIFRTCLSFVGISFYTLPAYIWGMQILLNAIFVATGIICIQTLKEKNKGLLVGLFLLVIVFLGNLYYNNALGFIGNNFRMSIHAISTIVLFEYFKEYKKELLWLFILLQLGLCGVASTGTFSIVFVLFALFFVLYDKEKNLLKYYAISLYVPLLTILVTKFYVKAWIFIGAAVFCAVVYFLNDWILKLFQHKAVRIGSIILVCLILYAGSIVLSGDLINIQLFFTNYSEIADMSWDYFMFNDLKHWLFNLIVLIPFAYYIIKNKKHPFSIVAFILIITFFNPLFSYFMNVINWVYYRAYDILINQYTLCLFIVYLYHSLKKTQVKKLLVLGLLVVSSVLSIIQVQSFYHASFIPTDTYNYIYKIDDKELEVIYNVETMIEDLGIENPAIITSTFYMPSFIDDSTYLFGKEKRYNYDEFDDVSYALYLILFPVDYIYDNFRSDDIPDYQNTVSYLQACDYDILVVEHGLYYENEETGEYLPITSLIEADGIYEKTIYSTSKYAVYYLGD